MVVHRGAGGAGRLTGGWRDPERGGQQQPVTWRRPRARLPCSVVRWAISSSKPLEDAIFFVRSHTELAAKKDAKFDV